MIVDGSGSMMKDRNDVVDGVNQFIEEQQDETPVVGESVYFSLTVFDDKVYERVIEENIDQVQKVDVKDTFLGGSTALFDAVGKTLTRAEDEKFNARHMVYIYTDGQENVSQEFTHEQIKDLFARLQKLNNWTIVFMSAEFGQWDTAKSLGITQGNYMTTTGAKGNHFAAASAGTTSLRRKTGLTSTPDYRTTTADAVDWAEITVDENTDNDPED
jgi:uncharacterized protein YegL